jgi:hypothetical protein
VEVVLVRPIFVMYTLSILAYSKVPDNDDNETCLIQWRRREQAMLTPSQIDVW